MTVDVLLKGLEIKKISSRLLVILHVVNYLTLRASVLSELLRIDHLKRIHYYECSAVRQVLGVQFRQLSPPSAFLFICPYVPSISSSIIPTLQLSRVLFPSIFPLSHPSAARRILEKVQSSSCWQWSQLISRRTRYLFYLFSCPSYWLTINSKTYN